MSQQLLTACVLITAMVGALFAIGKLVIYMWHATRKIVRMADDLAGEPPRGQDPGRPGVLDRLAAIERTDTEHLQVLDNLSTRLTAIESILATQDALEARLSALEARVPPAPEDPAGL
jgi:hypothetical protein